MTTKPSDRIIALHLLRGAVPECADELSALWRQYGHAVEVAPDTKGITMNADATRIRFDIKTIGFFWLPGFSAWRAIEVYSPALVTMSRTGMPLDQALDIDAERGQFEFDYKQRIASAQSLVAAERTTDISWPSDIPQPTADRDGLCVCRHKAVYELVALALGSALLHEFRHVIYCAVSSAPSTLPEEEIGFDAWARDFMTSGLALYAKEHGHDYIHIQQKHTLGIAFAAVIIHVMTPTHTYWGNRQYPPTAELLTAMTSGYSLPADSSFWLVTACLLIALMRQEDRPLDFVANSNQEMVEMLLARLR